MSGIEKATLSAERDGLLDRRGIFLLDGLALRVNGTSAFYGDSAIETAGQAGLVELIPLKKARSKHTGEVMRNVLTPRAIRRGGGPALRLGSIKAVLARLACHPGLHGRPPGPVELCLTQAELALDVTTDTEAEARSTLFELFLWVWTTAGPDFRDVDTPYPGAPYFVFTQGPGHSPKRIKAYLKTNSRGGSVVRLEFAWTKQHGAPPVLFPAVLRRRGRGLDLAGADGRQSAAQGIAEYLARLFDNAASVMAYVVGQAHTSATNRLRGGGPVTEWKVPPAVAGELRRLGHG